MEKKINEAIEYARSFLGCPYKWGGESPMDGFDCSGLVQEILSSVGHDPRGDQTAQGLFNYFERMGKMCQPRAGALSFYGDNTKRIRHVGFCINDELMIEAGGGSKKVVDIESAIQYRAYVRIRPIKYRTDFLTVYIPHY